MHARSSAVDLACDGGGGRREEGGWRTVEVACGGGERGVRGLVRGQLGELGTELREVALVQRGLVTGQKANHTHTGLKGFEEIRIIKN